MVGGENINDFTETVYEHVSGNDTFTITVAERWSKAMVNKLKERYPDEVDIRTVNADGSMVVHMPFSWMRIVPKRKDNRSAEERAEAAERMRQYIG